MPSSVAVTVVAVPIGWRCLLLEVERDSRLHMAQIWSAKLEVEWKSWRLFNQLRNKRVYCCIVTTFGNVIGTAPFQAAEV